MEGAWNASESAARYPSDTAVKKSVVRLPPGVCQRAQKAAGPWVTMDAIFMHAGEEAWSLGFATGEEKQQSKPYGRQHGGI